MSLENKSCHMILFVFHFPAICNKERNCAECLEVYHTTGCIRLNCVSNFAIKSSKLCIITKYTRLGKSLSLIKCKNNFILTTCIINFS